MKLSNLEQKLETYEQNKDWIKRFVPTVQIELLKAFIQELKTKSQVNIAEDIKYSRFMDFCKTEEKEHLFSDKYLNSGRKSAQLFQAWCNEEHNERQALTHRLPKELLTEVFRFFNKKDLESVAKTCRGFYRIVSHNGYQLFQKAPYPEVDYSQLLIDSSRKKILLGNMDIGLSVVAIAPNGDIVRRSSNKTICIWDAKTGECKQELKGHTDWISCLAVARNGDIVSGSSDKTIRIWDAETGKCKKVLEGHTNWIISLAIAPNGDIVSNSKDKTIRIWDAETGQCKQVLKSPAGQISSLAIAPNGDIVTSSKGNTICIWDAKTGECKQELKGHTDWISCLAVAPNGDIVSGSSDKTIRIWDAKTGKCKKVLEGHTDWINSLAIAPNGDVISCSEDKTIRIWRFAYLKKSEIQVQALENPSEKGTLVAPRHVN